MKNISKEEQLYLAAIINANRHEKLHALSGLIKGTVPERRTKAASAANYVNNSTPRKPGYLERKSKLRELAKLVSG
jgi:hypothetical protein